MLQISPPSLFSSKWTVYSLFAEDVKVYTACMGVHALQSKHIEQSY